MGYSQEQTYYNQLSSNNRIEVIAYLTVGDFIYQKLVSGPMPIQDPYMECLALRSASPSLYKAFLKKAAY